jgi:hypothetical protein
VKSWLAPRPPVAKEVHEGTLPAEQALSPLRPR